jgi:type I restriction enzyme M protein
VPYEQIKHDLATARGRFRKLSDEFVSELKNRCGFMGDDKKRALVLELLEQDVDEGLETAVTEKRQALTRVVEKLWDKYRITLRELRCDRQRLDEALNAVFKELSYL